MKDTGHKWILIGLAWFLSIAIMGLLMRYLAFGNIDQVNYKYILHAHSHVALLGWVYTAIFVGIINLFFDENYTDFKPIFIFTQITILGMAISFPFQGYALFSITFSTLFLFAAYWFVIKVFRSISSNDKQRISTKFLKASLIYLTISTIGPWALGPVMVMGFKHDPLYYNTIYFFLHFLYNGFIVMALLAFIYRIIEESGVIPSRLGIWNYRLLQWSIIPSFALSLFWSYDKPMIHIIGIIAAIILFLSLIPLLRDVSPLAKELKKDYWIYNLLRISLLSYILKVSFQLVSSIPALAPTIYHNSKYLVIGYLHLVFLGFVSLFLFGFLFKKGIMYYQNSWAKSGIILFIAGIIISEFLLFYRGAAAWINLPAIPNYHLVLVLGSLPLFIGIVLLTYGQKNNKIE